MKHFLWLYFTILPCEVKLSDSAMIYPLTHLSFILILCRNVYNNTNPENTAEKDVCCEYHVSKSQLNWYIAWSLPEAPYFWILKVKYVTIKILKMNVLKSLERPKHDKCFMDSWWFKKIASTNMISSSNGKRCWFSPSFRRVLNSDSQPFLTQGLVFNHLTTVVLWITLSPQLGQFYLYIVANKIKRKNESDYISLPSHVVFS